MKNKLFLTGAIGIILVFGVVLLGCPAEEGTIPTTYTITFDGGEGGGTPPTSQKIESGKDLTLPGKGNLTAPVGKEFDGWKGDGKTLGIGDAYTVTKDVTFIAQWKDSVLAPAFGIPQGVIVTPGNTQLTVAWGSVTDATSYKVYWRTSDTAPDKDATNNTEIVNVPTTSYIIKDLVNNTTYNIWIAARKGNDYSEFSSVKTGKPAAPEDPPARVTKPTVESLNDGKLKITWGAANLAEKYEVLVSTRNDTDTAGLAANQYEKSALDTKTEFTSKNLQYVTYYVFVRAWNSVNGGSYGGWSDPAVQVKPKAPPTTLASTTWANESGSDKINFYQSTYRNTWESNGGGDNEDNYTYVSDTGRLTITKDNAQTTIYVTGDAFTIWGIDYLKKN
jgi:hypothetical protein